MPHSLFWGPPFSPASPLLQRLTTPVNCGMLKKKRRPVLDALQKQNITMGKTEEPIGSRRERQLPTACAGEHAPTQQVNPVP